MFILIGLIRANLACLSETGDYFRAIYILSELIKLLFKYYTKYAIYLMGWYIVFHVNY